MTNDDFFAKFMESRTAAGVSKSSMYWYGYVTRRYQAWLTETGKEALTITPLDMQGFIAWLREQNYSSGTVRQTVHGLKTVYNWAVEVEILNKDPLARTKRPKATKPMPVSVSHQEFDRLLASIEPVLTWIDHRDQIIFKLLYYTGLRLSEVARLMLSDVNLEDRQLRITRKGGKRQLLPFSPDLQVPLWQWINAWRPPAKVDNLFLSSHNGGVVRGGLRSAGVYWMVKRRAEAAGMPEKHPHSFRHGFAHALTRAGANLRLVQALMGHSHISTTAIYLQLDAHEVQEMADDIWNGRK